MSELVSPILAQNISVTYWLSAVWILSAGITAGFILAILGYLKIAILQRIPGLNSVADNRGSFLIAGSILTLVYFVVIMLLMFKGLPDFGALGGSDLRGMLFILVCCALLGFGAWKLISHKFAGEFTAMCTEGFPKWLTRLCVVFVAFFAIGFPLAKFDGFGVVKFIENPVDIMQSLARLPFADTTVEKYTVDPTPENHQGDPLVVKFDGKELKKIDIRSTEPIELSAEPISPTSQFILKIDPSKDVQTLRQTPDGKGMIKHQMYDTLYVNNNGKAPANIELAWQTGPFYMEVAMIPVTAIFIFLCFLAPVLLAAWQPKVSAIALSTFKTEISQPLFLLVMVLGFAFVVISIYIPYNTFGEDIKMYKDSGLNLIRVMAIFTAIWAASKSVAEEIEGRTALTVLSKPVSRRQFIMGKFAGIAFAIGLLFLVLGLWFMIWTAYKPIYDGQETANKLTDWIQPFQHAFNVVPGLILCFLEVLIFVAVSVAISTRMGVLPNFLICFSIYVLGHLTPQIVESSFGEFAPVVVFGQLIATVFPVLDYFDIQAAISRSSLVPLSYLAEMLLYTTLYSTFALLGSLVFFEDRDLA